MLNQENNNKLDNKIKQSLTGLNPKYNPEDWAKMESKLNALPKSTAFRWNHFLNLFIGLGILGGAYFLYNTLTSDNENKSNSTLVPPVSVNEKVNTEEENPNPNTNQNVTAVPESKSTENIVRPTEPAVAKEKKFKEEANNTVVKSMVPLDKKLIESTSKPQQIFQMGNEPIFGDMLDSSKGLIGETKENEATKKEAIIRTDNRIGWEKFLNGGAKADSSKKNKVELKKDSLNGQDE